VAIKPQVKIKVFKCGTCKKRHNNPLTHVCKIRMDRPRRKRR